MVDEPECFEQQDLVQVVGLGSEDTPAALVHAPLTVRPSPFPRASFEKAKRAATVFNTLIDRVSRDSEYLQQTLALAAEHDDFTVRQLNIQCRGTREAVLQLRILRSQESAILILLQPPNPCF